MKPESGRRSGLSYYNVSKLNLLSQGSATGEEKVRDHNYPAAGAVVLDLRFMLRVRPALRLPFVRSSESTETELAVNVPDWTGRVIGAHGVNWVIPEQSIRIRAEAPPTSSFSALSCLS